MIITNLWVPSQPTADIILTSIKAVDGASSGLDADLLDGQSSSYFVAVSSIDDVPVDGETSAPISSNWAFDHAALTTAHGISSFGSTLVDDDTAATARGTLGLGSASTHDAVDFTAGERRFAFADPYVYMGTAPAGTLDSAETWTLTRLTVAADGSVSATKTATDSWNDRVTATYN